MFLIDILVYVFFAYVMHTLGSESVKISKNPYNIDIKLWWYIIFFTLICALRGNTGVDTMTYAFYFKHGFYGGNLTKVNGEWAFWCLCDFLSSNSIHFIVGHGICAFLQIFFIVKGVLPHRSLLIYFPIVLFGSELFLNMTNAVRQMIAASIFFFAVQFIVARNLVKYMFCIICASLFHHSALMLSVLYFIPLKIDVSNRRKLMAIIYITCVVLGNSPQFQFWVDYIRIIMSSIGYNHYSGSLSVVLDENYTGEVMRFGPMQLTCFLCGFAIIWFGPYIGKKYRKSMPMFRLWYLFAVIYCCIYFLVCNVSHLMIRPIMYFLLFKAIILSLILMEFVRSGRMDVLCMHVARILVLVIWINIVWNIIKNWELPGEVVTYKLFFTWNL